VSARRRQRPSIVAPPPEEGPRKARAQRARKYRVVVVPTQPDPKAAEALLAWLAAQLRP
jgi:hypothetical protein